MTRFPVDRRGSSFVLWAIVWLTALFYFTTPPHRLSGYISFSTAPYIRDPDAAMVGTMPQVHEGYSEDQYCDMSTLIRPPYRCYVFRRWFDDIEQRDI